jgi:hypothetical protein
MPPTSHLAAGPGIAGGRVDPLLIAVAARPAFRPIWGRIMRLSAARLELLCGLALQPGTRLALQWDYGPPRLWRTVLARVEAARGLLARCALEGPLAPGEGRAFLAVCRACDIPPPPPA